MSNKKQTAMQLAIKHYEKLSEKGSNQAYIIAKFLKDNFLKLEKQQIIDNYKAGSDYRATTQESEQYYKETYEQ